MEQEKFEKMLDHLITTFYYITEEKFATDDGALYLTQEQKNVFVKHSEHLARIARESKVRPHGASDLDSPTEEPK